MRKFERFRGIWCDSKGLTLGARTDDLLPYPNLYAFLFPMHTGDHNPDAGSLLADTKISDEELIGIGSAALGVSSCFDAPIRVWRREYSTGNPSARGSKELTLECARRVTVTRHRVKYGPLYYPFVADPAFEPAGKNRLMKKMPRSWWSVPTKTSGRNVSL
jgi:hypothetical protein